ncbi:MAG: F0F1 ATP synthase subunit alpha [Lachnospiraceae bacterium]|jgi:F-type H+-transporting ATPase subunit alpha|nr:F0F1 ATP synthase subunit alpha [Lachnospiraceae bacterium]
MGIKPEEISSIIKSQIEEYGLDVKAAETGTVVSAGDGIVRIYGLTNCLSGEMLRFENGLYGLAVNLEEENIGCVLLGDDDNVGEGSLVERTGTTLTVPVGNGLIGRVVDALGNPLDGKGKIESTGRRSIEYPAPSVNDRQSVTQPLQTGIIAIDAMIPIGKGQRELIIGDRQTGKTSIAIDAILNQKDKGVICIYVGIGQKSSSMSAIVQMLEAAGAMKYTIIVSSSASDAASLQYIAPYAGCAMAEEFMYEQKKDVLIVYDDLSKHAVAYRAMSLLLRRPPGREAYPGDVFYLHSRLLERAAKLSDKLGGGSITALPIVETQSGDFSAYVPTNVVSITDGQIYLQADLFFSGVKPAVNVGISVSRVGGAAQIKAMKRVAGSLRINLAQYRDLEVFAQFGSDLDKATRNKLLQGERLVEILKQPNGEPMTVEEQVVILFIATGSTLMDIELKKVKRFQKEFYQYLANQHPHIIQEIGRTGNLSPEAEKTIVMAVGLFKKDWE